MIVFFRVVLFKDKENGWYYSSYFFIVYLYYIIEMKKLFEFLFESLFYIVL